MRRATTPTHTFKINIDRDLIKNVQVAYAQNGNVILKKNTADCEVEQGKIVTKLNQQETLLFDSRSKVQIQLRMTTVDGNALSTKIYIIACGDVLSDEVLE